MKAKMKAEWMHRMFAFVTILVLVLNTNAVTLAQVDTDAQSTATGLQTQTNPDKQTAGLGFIVKQLDWPALILRGGVRGSGTYWKSDLEGPIGIDLGRIMVPNTVGSFISETTDWAHNEMTFTYGIAQLNLWISRLSPAIVAQAPATALQLFTGNVSGNVINTGSVQPRPTSPSYPKYVAYANNGALRVDPIGTAPLQLNSLSQNWLLVWYGANSHFVDTRYPLISAQLDWDHGGNAPQSSAFQADAPILLVFQNKPTSVKRAAGGGIELAFAANAGYVSVLPLFGRQTLHASQTEMWSAGLPADVAQKAQWWADRMCAFPLTVAESYNYSAPTDRALITESFSYLQVCAGGQRFAPLPPMLALARDTLGITLSGPIMSANYPTEFGPYEGVENVEAYTWSMDGLRDYVDARRVVTGTAQAPTDLQQELVTQANKVMAAGHLAPWIFSDQVPRSNGVIGDIYWLNPADVLYHLIEIAGVLPDSVKTNWLNFIRSERQANPPEDIPNLSLTTGALRSNYALSPTLSRYGQTIEYWWNTYRQDVFLQRVPLYNFYSLAGYYELTRDALPAGLMTKAKAALDRDLAEQDWATLYWFKGFGERVAVTAANRYFSGLVGYIRLAELTHDTLSENRGRALLAKAAVLRVGFAEYPRFLYAANLIELPTNPEWQTYAYYYGFYNLHWATAADDARQVRILDQFGVTLQHSSSIDENYLVFASSELIGFRDMVPELGRLLNDYAPAEASVYLHKAQDLFPHWYSAFAEGILGSEHNLSHPIDSFQLFTAEAWLDQPIPDKLAQHVDIPWLETGDLFYMQKLSETIKAYKGVTWSDETGGSTPTPVPSPLPGDINGDHSVNAVDLRLILTNFIGSTVCSTFNCDVSGDGKVNLLDAAYVVKNFGLTW